MKATRLALFTLCFALVCTRAHAFSLIGPHAGWMSDTNGYRQDGGIGGPMAIGEEYRRTVPVLTYGFDAAFTKYFGAKGVKEVEAAIKRLNQLPKASAMSLSEFALNVRGQNQQALSMGLFDLESTALFCLLEQMGVAGASRHVFTLRRWDPYFAQAPNEADWVPSVYGDLILLRNYDPETLAESRRVNDVLFQGFVYGSAWMGSMAADAGELPVNPAGDVFAPVADGKLSPGWYFKGLSHDDAGALRYLLNKTNVNVEKLPPGTRLRGAANRFALREGVDRIRLVRHKKSGDRFKSHKMSFVSVTFQNGKRKVVSATRQSARPDIVFSVGDNVTSNGWFAIVDRTGTDAWVNAAEMNGKTNATGPGMIQGRVTIKFNRMGPRLETADVPDFGFPHLQVLRWGSFDQSTNVLAYPSAAATRDISVHVQTYAPANPAEPGAIGYRPVSASWLRTKLPHGAAATLQVSTNGIDWKSAQTVTNLGGTFEWHHYFSRALYGPVGGTNNGASTMIPTNLPVYRIVSGHE